MALLLGASMIFASACSDESSQQGQGNVDALLTSTPGAASGGFGGPGQAEAQATIQASPTPAPLYVGDPTDPQPPPTRAISGTVYFTETAHYVRGDFQSFYAAYPAPGLGLPLTEEFPQQFRDGRILRVQYFERGRLEYHSDLPSGKQVQAGALVPQLIAGRNYPRLPSVPNSASRVYFSETGHTLASGFLNYWRANGGLPAFGLPLSEELGEDGVTVQYFERARFEYHTRLEGTPYAVQLSPVGYMSLVAQGFRLPLGSLVRLNPPVLREGHTATIEVSVPAGITVAGQYGGNSLLFTHDRDRGKAWSLVGATAFRELGARPLQMTLLDSRGVGRFVTRNIEIQPFPFPTESLSFPDRTAELLDEALTKKERETLENVYAGRTPSKLWEGPFGMPLDGRVRITSAFATRRCYQCPQGSTPTTFHGGLDMGAPEGTPVRAPANGVVVLAEKLAVRGNTVVIDHGFGVFTLFAHNSRLDAPVGKTVKKGEIVARSGNTGLSNGPHLHWELHVNGPAVEPLEWVARSMP